MSSHNQLRKTMEAKFKANCEKLAKEEPTKFCANPKCGKPLTRKVYKYRIEPSSSYTPRKYCDKNCRIPHQAQLRLEKARSEPDEKKVCMVCGKVVFRRRSDDGFWLESRQKFEKSRTCGKRCSDKLKNMNNLEYKKTFYEIWQERPEEVVMAHEFITRPKLHDLKQEPYK